MPGQYEIMDRLRRTPLRRAAMWKRHRGLAADDVFVASFPRSGNTWLRFVLADLVVNETVTFRSVEDIVPAVGNHERGPRAATGGGRLIKTHEPYRREYRRAIYLVRDPRDVLMSYFRMHQTLKADLTLDEFVERFVRGHVDGYGSWEAHLRSWLGARDRGVVDLHLIRYEDFRRDPAAHVERAAAFAGIEATRERIEQALADNTADALKEREQADAEFLSKEIGWREPLVMTTQATVGGRELLTAQHVARLWPSGGLLDDLGYAV
jgi:hypothetical protein